MTRAVPADDERVVAEGIRASNGQGTVYRTTLDTNQRVMARVTDGIYREPGSAVRELVSNAYDADATKVIIRTDAPRFERFTIEDDGIGMTPEAIASLVKNIGGSVKRTQRGAELGVTDETRPDYSPGGRRLIGKLGIGIFSVSQLTRSFEVVTKTKGDDFRTFIVVDLHQFSDDTLPSDPDFRYRAGDVTIWREPTTDHDHQGTVISLTNIRPQTRLTLQSRERWDLIDRADEFADSGESRSVPPTFHIGRVDEQGDLVSGAGNRTDHVPWGPSDTPAAAFRKLVDAVWTETQRVNPSVQLKDLFDYYLRMVWTLGLALPVEYYDGQLFDKRMVDVTARWFQLSDRVRRQALELEVEGTDTTVRENFGLNPPDPATGQRPFRVFFDDLELLRPIRYTDMATTKDQVRVPLIFVGRYSNSFAGYSREFTAGPLEFEAYFIWTPKVVPRDHRGVLVRIHGAGDGQFDPSFFRYQIAENTRMNQTMCEVFVTQGLEPALNIDREDFNTAHPHMVVLIDWVHRAMRQIATTQKAVSSEIRRTARGVQLAEYDALLERIVEEAAADRDVDLAQLPAVALDSSKEMHISLEESERAFDGAGTYVFDPNVIWPESRTARSQATKAGAARAVPAIVRLLSVYGVLDQLQPDAQERLLRDIVKIIEASSGR